MFERLDDPFSGLPPARYTSLCVADIDGCGPRALVLGAVGAANRILALRPGGPVDCDPDRLAEAAAATVAVCAGDVDGDGAEELFLGHGDPGGRMRGAGERLFDLDAGEWHDLLGPGAAPGPAWLPPVGALAVPAVGLGCGILVLAPGAPARLLAATGSEGVRDLAPLAGLDEPLPSSHGRFGPWPDGSGRLLVAADDGPWLLERGSERAFVEHRTTGAMRIAPAGALAFVSALPDGRLDLFRASQGGDQQLLAAFDGGRIADVTPRLLGEAGPVLDALAADFDGDGEEELLLLCDGEPNRLFGWREGGWRPLDAGAATLPLGRHAAAAFFDLDRDGCPELVLLPGEAVAERPLAFRGRGCGPAGFVGIAVRGISGAPARGAEVRSRIAGRWRVRVLDCGGGRVQSEPVAWFGTGGAASVEEVRIRWPDGAATTLRDLAAGRVHTVRHPSAGVR